MWQHKQGKIAVTIEIRQPELEALIMERMKSGDYKDVEDLIMQTFVTASLTMPKSRVTDNHPTSGDLIKALQSSPYREIEIEPVRYRLPA